MRVALVVTTFERPDALARVLESVAAQSRPPDELAIADDGSGPATRALVAAHAARTGRPVVHAWHAHDGFRAGAARNRAIARVTSDYVVLIDGDMVLDREFVADHAAAATRGCWTQGCRLPLDAAATRAVLAGDAPERWRTSLDARHRLQGHRRPALARTLAPVAGALLAVKACNQGHWRADLQRVNGYDEELVGWGAEDKELCARLAHAGVRRRGLLCAALAWHLHHAPASRDRASHNLARLATTRAERRTRCVAGLDRHPANG